MSDQPPAPNNQRQRFRLRHPSEVRPKLVIDEQTYDVLDVSEGGLKFFANELPPGIQNGRVDGQMVFRDGESIPVKGRVVRYEIAVQFEEGVPYKKIVSEQIGIFKHFPNFGHQ
ncbi:MAG: PilZ domain-containing protein [Phycisphaerae bacterium]|nr:PilZ domain-containing protein [Phycisphaerae bacterium]